MLPKSEMLPKYEMLPKSEVWDLILVLFRVISRKYKSGWCAFTSYLKHVSKIWSGIECIFNVTFKSVDNELLQPCD
jgi:hypothetical protein